MHSRVRTAVDDRASDARVELRDPALCWPDLVFDRERVIALGVPAHCWTADGALWELEDGAFYVTAPPDRVHRRREHDAACVPDAGWVHPSDCACPACRVQKR